MKANLYKAQSLGALFAVLSLAVILSGCEKAQNPTTPTPAAEPVAEAPTEAPAEVRPTQRWQCRNDLEIHCGDGTCASESAGGFTPMSVDFDDAGTMSVCAYSGCWEGSGDVVASDPFLVLVGRSLPFSTAPDAEEGADVVIALDLQDAVATLKVDGFAHPVLCDRLAAES